MSRDYGSRTGKVQAARSVLAGRRPDFLKAGALAVNITDKRIWVGDLGDEAKVFSTRIETFDADKGYLEEDLVIHENELWYALTPKTAGTDFIPADWFRLTNAVRSAITEPYATALLSGGAVSRASSMEIAVTAGSGVIVDNTDPTDLTYTLVSWAAFTAPLTPPESGWQYVSIQSTGALGTGPLEDLDGALRRQEITLAAVRWDSGGTIDDVLGQGYLAAGTAENFRDLYNATGGAFRAEGMNLEPTTGLGLQITAGAAFALGWNREADPQNPNVVTHATDTDPLTFNVVTQDDTIIDGTVNLDPTIYDNNGVVTAVPDGAATIQYVYASADLSIVYVQLGQTVYNSVAGAAAGVEEDWENLVNRFDPPLISFAAICVAQDAVDLSGATIIRAERRSADPYSNKAELQDAAYVYLDGSRPMEGSLNLGGYNLTNGKINGGTTASRDVLFRSRRSAVTSEIPTATAAEEEGELFINHADRKVYARDESGTMKLVSDRIADHSETVAYVEGDFCVQNDTLYRASSANGPGVFDLADWDAMSADLTDVIVKAPAAVDQNEITPVASTITGLKVSPSPSQAAPLTDFHGAQVDAEGYANYRYGPANFLRNQTSHPFSSIGQAASFTGGLYQRADAAAGDGKAYGIVEEIAGADAVLLRTNGRITGLDPASFVEGVITPGSLYYVSTTPGLLTATQPVTPDRVDPVLLADSTTSGIVVVDSGISDASDRVATAGDVMTGSLSIVHDGSPGVRTRNTELGTDQSMFAAYVTTNGDYRIQPTLDAGGGLPGHLGLQRTADGLVEAVLSVAAADDPAATPSGDSLMNRTRAIRLITDIVYPIGIVIESTKSTNPGTYIPGTTWKAFAPGRVKVGVGAYGGYTWNNGTIRGLNTLALNTNHLPKHAHWVDPPAQTFYTSYAGRTDNRAQVRGVEGNDHVFISTVGGFSHTWTGAYQGRYINTTNDGGGKQTTWLTLNNYHRHSVVVDIGGFWSNERGLSSAFEMFQPSIGVYMWERTG